MTINEKTKAQMEGLATLLVLNDEIRKVSNIREFGFFTTNETHRLIPYHVALLWKKNEVTGTTLLAQSGTPEVDNNSITNQWLRDKIEEFFSAKDAKQIHQIDLLEIEKKSSLPSAINWVETFPTFVLWCPLLDKSKDLSGGLLFFRETPFSDSEIKMINWLLASYQYTWSSFLKHHRFHLTKYLKKKPIIIGICLILIFPIHLSVLGTATVSPKDPVLINSPLEGVIKSFAVSPGDTVEPGQLLFTLDKTDLESNVEVTNKELLLTQAKLRTAINQGLDNHEIYAEVPILKAQLAIDQARINYTNSQLSKTNVTSPISGIVIFDSKEDWVGQPVRTGERILMVTDPSRVELKIMLPITNVIDLKINDDGDFFPYGSLQAIPVKIKTLGYNAKLMPNKILAFELTADFTNKDNKPQLGSQGNVRLYGRRVPLIYYLLRRPLQTIRQAFGM